MSAPLAIHRAGDRALLLDLESTDAVMAWHSALSTNPLPGQIEAVAAAATVLISFSTPSAARSATRELAFMQVSDANTDAGQQITIDVSYDGEDLDELAAHLGISTDALIERHTNEIWRAAFTGFAPGFVYCDAPEGDWNVPRRSTPRTRVPAGSVAVAGAFSAVYPTASPGGWQLLGRTEAVLFDVERTPPALIAPGETVQYRAQRPQSLTNHTPVSQTPTSHTAAEAPADSSSTTAAAVPESAGAAAPAASAAAGQPVLRIDATGLQALFEDAGRPGLGDQGVSASGAADEEAYAQANRLVGNPAGAVAVEVLLGSFRATALADCVLAVTGAATPLTISSDGRDREAPLCAPLVIPAGTTLSLGAPEAGMRSYIACRGGFAADQVLGSASADVLSGLGPQPLQAGDELRRIGADVSKNAALDAAGAAEPTTLSPQAVLRVIPGPRDDWFDADSLTAFTAQPWTVTEKSNRVGVRLTAEPATDAQPAANAQPATDAQPAPTSQSAQTDTTDTTAAPARSVLRRSREGELASEGMVAGSVQVPPSGEPVVFLSDHPVTGGYPVIGTVISADLPIAAQAAPGTQLRFSFIDSGASGAGTNRKEGTDA